MQIYITSLDKSFVLFYEMYFVKEANKDLMTQKMTTLILTIVLFICNMTGKIECQGNIKAFNSMEMSEKSSKPCDMLSRQGNIRNPRHMTKVQLPAQSLTTGNYTPWIAYRGCYQISTLPKTTNELLINNNTVGNCYRECKMKVMKNNSCGNITDVLFGLQKSLCFCFCNAPVPSDLDHSDRCNMSCSSSSFEDGECGGQGHFSAYEEYNPQGGPLAGLCLICSKSSSNTITIGSTECDTNATGVCVSDDSLNSTTHFNGTMNSYWSNCKTMSRYITGNTDIVCQKTATWTGIRKYKIETDNYQITTPSVTVGPSYTPSNNILVATVGLIFTIIIVLSIGCLVWYFRKRRAQKPQNCITTVNNITYDDVITRPESDRKQNSATCSSQTKLYEDQKHLSSKTEDIYVQKDDGQYDCLHSSRQKQVSFIEGDRYGDTSCLDDSYSTSRQARKSSLILDDQYNSIALPGYNGNSCFLTENPNYDHIYQPERETDCYIYKCTNVNIP